MQSASMTEPKVSPEEAAKHVTIWNRREQRKIAGNAAPLRRNLARYLKKHPECEEYKGQDKDPNRATIDPVTGENILHLNEHVPIWHTLENRKVTGNAAPLRKNLQAYLKKHPHCEVYNNQDKLPGVRGQQWQSSSASQLAGRSAPGKKRAPHVGPKSDSLKHQFYADIAEQSSRQMHSQLADAPPPDPPPIYSTPPQPVPARAAPSYNEMVASWSNQPAWTDPYPTTPGSYGNGMLSVGTPKHGSLFSSQPFGGSSMEGVESSINGIPIPGGVARDRDVVMGTSMGNSLGNGGHFPAELGSIFGATPKSMEYDGEATQFSPSNFLSIGSLPGKSPPMSITRPTPSHKETSMPQ